MKKIKFEIGLKEIFGIIIIAAILSFSFSSVSNPTFKFGSVVLIDTTTGSIKIGHTVLDIYADEFKGNYLKLFDNNTETEYTMRINYALQKLTFIDSLNTVYNFAFDGNQSVDLDSCGISIVNTAGSDYLKFTDVYTSSGDSSGMTQEGVIKVNVSGVVRYIRLYK